MNLKEHIKFLRTTKELLEEATGYTQVGLTYNGVPNNHDLDNKERIAYVQKARDLFVRENTATILALAAQLVQDELDEAGV